MLVGISIFGYRMLKLHKTSSVTFKFGISAGILSAIYLYNRYTMSLKIFDFLSELESEKFEKERVEIIRESFCSDYMMNAGAIEEEYRDSMLPLVYKLKIF